jgi:threonylcarbamoyladenosine tRNA methylthiotransferase MtaB
MKDFSLQVCPHLHVCLQSGSDRILRGMKRRWTRRHIIDRCELVKNELHLPAFTTDVIVGFPGETEKDFADTVDACRQIGFSKIHMFPFSPRKGTPAAEMEEQVPKKIKSERGAKIAALETELKREYFQSLVGERLQLLVEKVNDDQTVTGTSCRYATVNAIAPNAAENELISVEIESAGAALSGRAI